MSTKFWFQCSYQSDKESYWYWENYWVAHTVNVRALQSKYWLYYMKCYKWQNTKVIVEKILPLAESVCQRYNWIAIYWVWNHCISKWRAYPIFNITIWETLVILCVGFCFGYSNLTAVSDIYVISRVSTINNWQFKYFK